MKRIGRMFLSHTESERRSTLAGVNLFFGALLGAHLGTMGDVPIDDYIFLIMLLAGAVAGIFTVAGSRRTGVIWATVSLYVLVFAAILFFPEMQPRHMEDEIQRIVAMLAIWLVVMVVLRFMPVLPEPEAPDVATPLPIEDET